MSRRGTGRDGGRLLLEHGKEVGKLTHLLRMESSCRSTSKMLGLENCSRCPFGCENCVSFGRISLPDSSGAETGTSGSAITRQRRHISRYPSTTRRRTTL